MRAGALKWIFRVFGLFLLLASPGWAAVPASWLGLTVRQTGGAITFAGRGVRLTFIPGFGWAPPLPASLPPPKGEALALEPSLLRAAGLWDPSVPVVRLRLGRYPEKWRVVFDLPAPVALPTVARRDGPFELELPFYVENPIRDPRLRFVYGPLGTRLIYSPPPGRVAFLYAFGLGDPPRYVVDLYAREPERREVVRPGFVYWERYAYVPYPLKLYGLSAAPGAYELRAVGVAGKRQDLSALASGAVGLINGGYFDPATGTPIGLWVSDGVTIAYPYGRATLVSDGYGVDAVFPRVRAWVRFGGRQVAVGMNATPARLTAYTVPGVIGRRGEALLVVRGGRVVARRKAPYRLAAGYWALAYPEGEAPYAHLPLGTAIHLRVRLDPPVRWALEAGPLLVQGGRYAYTPSRERFEPGSPVIQKVTYQAAVAWTREGAVWFVVSEKTTPGVLARALARLGAWGALRMDSGGSAQLWVDGTLRFPDRARAVVNGWALYPRLTSPAPGP